MHVTQGRMNKRHTKLQGVDCFGRDAARESLSSEFGGESHIDVFVLAEIAEAIG